MIRKRFSLLVIAAVFLTGWAMIPKYTRLETPIPAEYEKASETAFRGVGSIWFW